jgi:hypothetical protein
MKMWIYESTEYEGVVMGRNAAEAYEVARKVFERYETSFPEDGHVHQVQFLSQHLRPTTRSQAYD